MHMEPSSVLAHVKPVHALSFSLSQALSFFLFTLHSLSHTTLLSLSSRTIVQKVSTLCLLVGDESDFMFEDFKQALAGAARAKVGAAHFLFADAATEPRVGSLLKASRAQWPRDKGAPPVVVLVSMAGGFAPRKLEGESVTTDGVLALLDAAAAEEGRPRLDARAPDEL
jgi:hypothetical protein